jgi:hypothetical protein
MEEKNEEYVIATSANYKTFEQISDFKRIINNLRDTIDNIVQGEQHLIFMIKGTKDNVLQKIPEIFGDLVQKYPERIWSNSLYSGGITSDDEEHDSLVVAPGVKFYYGDAIKNVYAPNKRGYSIQFDQARVSYEIKDPNQLEEFWHTEPAAIEQFLMWKIKQKQPIKNVIIVSRKPMCQFCSAFLLHCFHIEATQKSDVNFIVFSLSALESIAKADNLSIIKKQGEISPELLKLRKLLSTVVGHDTVKRGGISKEVDITMFDKIKVDLKGTSGNNLSIYGF